MIRMGLLYPASDPISPSIWSGTPAGLYHGLGRNGVEMIAIAAKLPPVVRQLSAASARWGRYGGAVADRSAPLRELRTRLMARNLRQAGHLDAVLAMGTELYDLNRVLPPGLRCYTYDDGTLAQMWEHPHSDLRQSGLPADRVRVWIRHQAEASRRADGCFVSTSWAASSFVSHYRVDPEGVKIVGIGHRQRQRSASASRQWSHPRYLFVGVDWKRKNGAAVVAAFRRVHSMVPTATLHLVGGIPHIDEPGVVSHGLLPRGDARAQRTLDSLYASATCFVLPSRFEPAGIAYLEAGSAGLPVIATTQGGASELLESGALPVSPYDVGAITDAMMTAASGDKAEHMGELAAKAAAKSSWEKVASRILAGISFAQENAYVGSTS